jgi:putative glycosyltransferase (TIGR04372 family)
MRIVKLLCLAVAALITPLSRIVDRFWKFRITAFNATRFGHLAADPQLYLARLAAGESDGVRFRRFFCSEPCNRQLLRMWQRLMPIHECRPLWAFYQYTFPVLHKSPVFRPLPHPDYCPNAHELVARAGGLLGFTAEEEARGRELLAELGLAASDWFVCFNGRELSAADLDGNREHRNSRLDTYFKAARAIADLGGYAIRVGLPANEPLPAEARHPRIIDYAFERRSEFGDIYLLAKCRFLVGCATGTINIPSLFGKAVAFANMIPYGGHPNPRGLVAPKLLVDKRAGELMHFREVFDYLMSKNPRLGNPIFVDQYSDFENDFVGLVDNTEDDIVDLCLDMLDQTAGQRPPAEAVALQREFKEIFYSWSPDRLAHAPNIGPRFALRHRRLIQAPGARAQSV